MTFKVFAAIGATFGFLFRNFLSVIHVVWLAVVLQIAGFVLLASGPMQVWTNFAADPPADGGEAFGRMMPQIAPALLFLLVFIATVVVISTGLARLALKGKKPKLPFHLAWGRDEMRVFICTVIIGGCFAGVAIAYNIFNWLARLLLSSGPIANMLAIVGAIAIVLVGIYVWVRLCLFTPATVAEGKIGIRTSWEKTEDLFWPLFGFWVLLVLMVWIVQAVCFPLYTPPAYFEVMKGASFTSREAAQDMMRDMYAAMAAGYDISDPGNAMRQTIYGALQAIPTILMALGSIMAWKQLADPDEQAAAF